MERRQIRRTVAQKIEAHVLAFEFDLGADATTEDRAEAARQKAYVLEPLLKKLRRAQGHGKQTGHIMTAITPAIKIRELVSAENVKTVQEVTQELVSA